jgi:hypothetical protein
MSKSTVPDLKELFKHAAEIAKQVPESMQVAAFNRAIDLLTEKGSNKQPADQKQNSDKENKLINKVETANSSIDVLLSAIDSTQHPEVVSASKVIDRALMVLNISLTFHNVDGLTPIAIARILTEKFRVNDTKKAVSMALGRATTLVNRIPDGQGFLYKIMNPGKEYLEHLGAGDGSLKAPMPSRKKRNNRTSIKENNSSTTQDSSTKKINRKTKKKNGADQQVKKKNRIGPKAAILNLIETGFFDKGKTGPEVQAYLKVKRGFNIGIAQLRLAMLRLLHDGTLVRDDNAEGHYEYTKPKA